MIPQKFEYSAPKSLDEALALLARGAKPLAGGMSLIPMMKLRLAAPEHLVDLRRLRGLDDIRESGRGLEIGAIATHYDVENSPLIRQKCPLLAETAGAIGDVQVRNMGTIGGSVAHADPSADYPAALQALEARFVLKGAKGERTVSAADFFLDAFTTALETGEIVREILVPSDDARTGTSYKKVAQPASGFAIVGVAARVRQKEGKFSFVRIGITGLGNSAYRAVACERALEGRPATPAAIESAAALAAQGIDANSDLHASADYRRHLAAVHTARALATALSRIV
ncbi:MAG TPA: xanthine dehydrogenase family protein subunit M [Candidatus Cybelea sp.]|nr:xanthine dehydrogenase family protein subunit M [Candidatus Cybelea sp.]